MYLGNKIVNIYYVLKCLFYVLFIGFKKDLLLYLFVEIFEGYVKRVVELYSE